MLHKSHRSTIRNFLLNILYHNCTFRCPFGCRCLCMLHCRNIQCIEHSPCRNGLEDSKLLRCRCRTTWRNLKQGILIIAHRVRTVWRTWKFFLTLPPEFNVALVLLGNCLALLFASAIVGAKRFLDLNQSQLARLVASQLLFLPMSVAPVMLSTLSFL